MKRVFTKNARKNGLLLGAAQDGSREWITVLACICSDKTALPPSIIYSAKSGNVQDTWLDDWEPEKDTAYFVSSESGWTNDELGFTWLTTIFDRHTKAKARQGRDWRLLIVDGHGSHLNMKFLEWCYEHRILVLAFPPHSTHRLQPLDVTCFRALARYYSNNLNDWTFNTRGLSRLSKREFWGIFYPAWQSTMSDKVIESAWKQTGLLPLNPEAVLKQVDKHNTEERPQSNHSGASAISASDRRMIQGLISTTVTDVWRNEAQKLINTVDHLATEVQLLRIENSNLQQAVQLEKKRRKRGRPIFDGLRDEENGYALFISPKKFLEARDQRQQAQDEAEAIEKAKAHEKERKKQEKEEKARQVVERKAAQEKARLERNAEKERKAKEREEAKLDKAANRQLQQETKATKQQQKTLRNQEQLKASSKEVVDVDNSEHEVEVVKSTTTRVGRNTKPTKPFSYK